MFSLPTDKGKPRTITKWNEVLSTLNSRIENLISQRYDLSTLERTPTYQLLDNLLSHIDLDEVSVIKDDVNKYFDYFIPNNVRLTQLFSDLFSIRPTTNVFIKSNGSTVEYLVPTSRANPVFSLPIGLGYDAWKEIPSMKILCHNSSHLPESFKFNIDFGSSKNLPTYVVIGIDVFVLGMKFIKYYNSHNKYDLPIMREGFIREELRFLAPDSVNVYLQNLVKDLVFDNEIVEPKKTFVSNFSNGLDLLERSIDEVFVSMWDSVDWFYTKWINGKSYVDLYNDLQTDWVIEDFKQNRAIIFIVFEPLISVMMRLGEYQTDTGFNNKFQDFYNTYINRMTSDNIWNYTNVQKIKKEIRASLVNMK